MIEFSVRVPWWLELAVVWLGFEDVLDRIAPRPVARSDDNGRGILANSEPDVYVATGHPGRISRAYDDL